MELLNCNANHSADKEQFKQALTHRFTISLGQVNDAVVKVKRNLLGARHAAITARNSLNVNAESSGSLGTEVFSHQIRAVSLQKQIDCVRTFEVNFICRIDMAKGTRSVAMYSELQR